MQKKPNKLNLDMLAAARRILKDRALDEPQLVPWCDAMDRLLARDVEGASEIATLAFNNGTSIDDRELIINCITDVAFEDDNYGHWFESMLLMAAESGLGHCAYNVGNLIAERATSPADYALADRYFQKAALFSTNPAVQAAALVNSCAAVRDGLITGTPDLPRAIQIYEQAAEFNLAVAMFNAANICCQMKNHGHLEYAGRAVRWLTTLINKVDAGETFVDLGGMDLVREVYAKANVLLTDLHALGHVEHVDVERILTAARTDGNPEKARWLRGAAYVHKLRTTAIEAKPAAWQNWLSVLTLMGWELAGEPTVLDLGPGTGESRMLAFKRQHGQPLAIAIVDKPMLVNNGGAIQLTALVKALKTEYKGPCIAIGSKAMFVQANNAKGGTTAYTVMIGDNEGTDILPIWPGATPDEVVEAMAIPMRNRLNIHNSDDDNTIAALVNALSVGAVVDGFDFPQSIYVNVGSMFSSPVLSFAEACELGCEKPQEEIEQAIAETKEYWIARKATVSRYWRK